MGNMESNITPIRSNEFEVLHKEVFDETKSKNKDWKILAPLRDVNYYLTFDNLAKIDNNTFAALTLRPQCLSIYNIKDNQMET